MSNRKLRTKLVKIGDTVLTLNLQAVGKSRDNVRRQLFDGGGAHEQTAVVYSLGRGLGQMTRQRVKQRRAQAVDICDIVERKAYLILLRRSRSGKELTLERGAALALVLGREARNFELAR